MLSLSSVRLCFLHQGRYLVHTTEEDEQVTPLVRRVLVCVCVSRCVVGEWCGCGGVTVVSCEDLQCTLAVRVSTATLLFSYAASLFLGVCTLAIIP